MADKKIPADKGVQITITAPGRKPRLVPKKQEGLRHGPFWRREDDLIVVPNNPFSVTMYDAGTSFNGTVAEAGPADAYTLRYDSGSLPLGDIASPSEVAAYSANYTMPTLFDIYNIAYPPQITYRTLSSRWPIPWYLSEQYDMSLTVGGATIGINDTDARWKELSTPAIRLAAEEAKPSPDPDKVTKLGYEVLETWQQVGVDIAAANQYSFCPANLLHTSWLVSIRQDYRRQQQLRGFIAGIKRLGSLQLVGGDYYESFDTSDTTNFKITKMDIDPEVIAVFDDDEVALPGAAKSDIRIMLVPKLWTIAVSFTSTLSFGSTPTRIDESKTITVYMAATPLPQFEQSGDRAGSDFVGIYDPVTWASISSPGVGEQKIYYWYQNGKFPSANSVRDALTLGGFLLSSHPPFNALLLAYSSARIAAHPGSEIIHHDSTAIVTAGETPAGMLVCAIELEGNPNKRFAIWRKVTGAGSGNVIYSGQVASPKINTSSTNLLFTAFTYVFGAAGTGSKIGNFEGDIILLSPTRSEYRNSNQFAYPWEYVGATCT